MKPINIHADYTTDDGVRTHLGKQEAPLIRHLAAQLQDEQLMMDIIDCSVAADAIVAEQEHYRGIEEFRRSGAAATLEEEEQALVDALLEGFEVEPAITEIKLSFCLDQGPRHWLSGPKRYAVFSSREAF